VVADLGRDSPESVAEGTDIFKYYGSLSRSGLSLYQAVTGGISWIELVDPLVKMNTPLMVVVFSIYIAFTVFAMLNVITGVFVESALTSAKHENSMDLMHHLHEVVENMNLEDARRMTWEQFEGQLENPHMDEYFRATDLSKDEAKGLFELMDFDRTGFIDADEFIKGCLRINGPAKAIDLVTLMCEVKRMCHQWDRHAEKVEDVLTKLANDYSSATGSRFRIVEHNLGSGPDRLRHCANGTPPARGCPKKLS